MRQIPHTPRRRLSEVSSFVSFSKNDCLSAIVFPPLFFSFSTDEFDQRELIRIKKNRPWTMSTATAWNASAPPTVA